MKKKVVIIGGGNGGAKSIRACSTFIDDVELSAVISVSDSGGSSGRLREEFKTLPPGDMLRAILAMSKHDYEVLKPIFYTTRFDVEGKLNKHNLGNLFLTLGEQYSEDYMQTVRAFEQGIGAQGKVYPATLDLTHINATLEDGTKIHGEHDIDRPIDTTKKITKLEMDPGGKAHDGAVKVIEEADYIVLGPGSLYCSIVATLLPSGIREAIEKSTAKLVFVVGNAFEEEGEAGPKTRGGMVQALEEYLPRRLDFVVFNNHKLSEDQQKWYAEKKWKLFELDEIECDCRIIEGDYERDERPGLDDKKLGAILKSIIV